MGVQIQGLLSEAFFYNLNSLIEFCQEIKTLYANNTLTEADIYT